MTALPRLGHRQLTAVAEAYWANGAERALAVQAEPVWDGEDVITVRGGAVLVRTARSPLQVREALVEAEKGGTRVAVLTPLTHDGLGSDVLARLVKGRVVRADRWAVLSGLFDAEVLDPAITARPALADALTGIVPPPGGWRPAVGRILTLAHLWSCLDEWLFGSPWDGSIGPLRGLLPGPHVPDRLALLPDAVRTLLAERATGFPTLAAAWLELARTGRSDRIVPAGLAFGVTVAPTTDPALATPQAVARALISVELGLAQVDPVVASAWAAAVHGGADESARLAAEAMLRSAQAEALAELSDELPSALALRMARAGRELSAVLHGTGSAEDLAAALRSVEHHVHAGRDRRLDRLRAAVRLTARVAPPAAGSFAALAAWCGEHGRFVDHDRELVRVGDAVPELVDAYRQLLGAVDAERSAFDERFATALADWSRTSPLDGDPVLPIERVLERVVKPLLADVPVLVLVLDGLSHPVAVDLVDDLARRGWSARAPQTVASLSGLVAAALPTVTEVSRASLLCGRLTTGAAKDEVAGFTSLALFAGTKPELFHKGGLAGGPGAAIDPVARAVIADPDRAVVGVVVNAVDDHLTRGDQIAVDWRVESLGPLAWVMQAAEEAGRAVVIVADHGHVIDHGSARRVVDPDGGERWHVGPAREGEIVISGPRVLKGDGTVTMPWLEQLTYGTPKHGYHGGATPVEVLCPCVVLVRDRVEVQHWVPAGLPVPAWWGGASTPSAPVAGPAGVVPAKPSKRPKPVAVGDTLFPEMEASWVDRLLASDLLQQQRARAARAPVSDEQLRVVLTAVQSAGGTITHDALVSATGVGTKARLAGLIQSVRRLLNVEGYQVLEDSDGTVRLNAELLHTQFGVRPA